MPRVNLDADLQRLFDFEFWADREVLTALRQAREAPPRALAIMNHVLAAAHLWHARLTGEKIKVDVWPALSIEEMSARIDALQEAWRKWTSAVSPADLDRSIGYVNSLGESWSSTMRDIITHLLIHAGYHRGQIAMLLAQAGHKAAYTDFIHAARRKFI